MLTQNSNLNSCETDLIFDFALCRVALQLTQKSNTAPVVKLCHVPARGMVMTRALAVYRKKALKRSAK